MMIFPKFFFTTTILVVSFLVFIHHHISAASTSHNNNNNQESSSASFTASIPQDRTVCDSLAARLTQNEIDSETSKLYPASMRIRKGVVRQSAEARSITPMYIAFSISSQEFYDGMLNVIENQEITTNSTDDETTIFNLLDARTTADSIASSFGLFSSDVSVETKIKYWQNLLPANASTLRPSPNFDAEEKTGKVVAKVF